MSDAGLDFSAGPDGLIKQDETVTGRVIEWIPGSKAVFEWHGAIWDEDDVSSLTIESHPTAEGCRLSIRHQGGAGHGLNPVEQIGWFASRLLAPVLRAATSAEFGDWLTDRRARKPSGTEARTVYVDPTYHRPNFRVLLEMLTLGQDDYLLEVGCGGGALLHDALESGCRAAAIDHSADMVALARRTNQAAVDAGRLEIERADAVAIPFANDSFTAGVMTGVLGFLPDPVSAFREIRRCLREGGRLAVLGSDAALKGTPAAPEPMASRLNFYTEEELADLARQAGFQTVTIQHHDLEGPARASGIPEEHVGLFRGPPTHFLYALK